MSLQKAVSLHNLSLSGSLIAASTSTYMASKRCVHILIRGSLLNIIYRRLQLDEPYITTKYLDETPIVRFKKTPTNPKNPIIRKYFQFLLGIKHAIDNNYLKEVHLYLKDSTGDILEAYKFRLKYNPKGDKLYETTPEPPEVKMQVIKLFEVIKALGDIEKLSNDTYPELELLFNADTPEEYEPPGFESCRSAPNLERVGALTAYLGSVNTGFHNLHYFGNQRLLEKLKAKEDKEGNEESNSNTHEPCAEKSQLENIETFTPETVGKEDTNAYELDTVRNDVFEDLTSNNDCCEKHELHASILLHSPPIRKDHLNTSELTDDLVEVISLTSEENNSMTNTAECICLLNLPEDAEMIPCTKCGRIVHIICQGFLTLDKSKRSNFKCMNCNKSDKLRNYDPIHGARMRLLIYYSKTEGKLSDTILECFTAEDKQKLHTYGIMKSDNSINIEVVNTALQAMFNSTDDSQSFD